MHKKLILLFFVLLAAAVGLAVYHSHQAWDSVNGGMPWWLKTSDGREFRCDCVIAMGRPESAIYVLPLDQIKSTGGMVYTKRDGFYVLFSREKIFSAKGEHVYFCSGDNGEKILREVPYAELGIPETPVFTPDAHGKFDINDNANRAMFGRVCYEKLQEYLETHAGDIFGEMPAENQKEPQV